MPLPTAVSGPRGGKQQQPQKRSLTEAKTTQTMQQAVASGMKSPIKKHLQNVASSPRRSTAKTSSPRSLLFPQQQTATFSTKSSVEGIKMAPARVLIVHFVRVIHPRAAIIQVMLGLLDQERATVEGSIPILQILAALPLGNASMRKQCIDMLTKLHEASVDLPKKYTQDARFDAASDVATSDGGDGDTGVSIMTPSFCYDHDDVDLQFALAPAAALPSSSQKSKINHSRDSGRPKSLSLHHCKEFLLACANEIHELEDENPNFDYAEDTSSERPTENVFAPRQLAIKRPSRASMDFDYASTAHSTSSLPTDLAGSFDGDQDDLEADQGSEFSEVLRRADYMSDFDDDETESSANMKTSAVSTLADIRERVLCRHVFQAWRRSLMRGSSSLQRAQDLKLKYRVFTALKQHGDHSLRNATRKKLAFEAMKSHSQQMRLKRSTMKSLRIATRHSLLLPSSAAIKQIPTLFNTAPSPASKTTVNNENHATERSEHVTTHSYLHLNLPLLRAKMLVSHHVDLVLFVVVALFMQTVLG